MNNIDYLKILLNPTGVAIEAIMSASRKHLEVSDSHKNDLKTLALQAKKMEIEAYALQSQAKVEQEVSIARRIMSAEEVEIEEYYDTVKSGNAGLKAEENNLSLGISGEGRTVTKRIVKFKGFNEQYVQTIQSNLPTLADENLDG